MPNCKRKGFVNLFKYGSNTSNTIFFTQSKRFLNTIVKVSSKQKKSHYCNILWTLDEVQISQTQELTSRPSKQAGKI